MVEQKEYMPLWWAGVPAELSKLRVEGRLCDITIIVGNSLRYSVHSLVLVSASSHFKASLDTGSLLQEYYLQDADEDCFKHLMEYVYGQNLVLNKDNVHSMLSTARALFIDSAIMHCEEFCKLLPQCEQLETSDSQQSCKLTDKLTTNPSPEFNNSLQLDASTSFSSDYLPGYDVDDQKVLERGIKQEPENFYPGENSNSNNSVSGASKGSDVHVTYEPITVGGKTIAMRSVIHENSNNRSQLHNISKYSPPDPDKPKNKTLEFICAQLSNKKNTCGLAESETSTNDEEAHMYSPNPFSPLKNQMELSWQQQGFGNTMRLCPSSQIRLTPNRYNSVDVPVSTIRREKDKSKYISTILNLRSQNSSPESMSPPIPSSSSHSMDTNPVWSTEITPSISEATSTFQTSSAGPHFTSGSNNNDVTPGLPSIPNSSGAGPNAGSNVASMNAATNALLSSVANQQAALQSLMMSMAGGTLPGLSGLMPGGFNGQFGANLPTSAQAMATGTNTGLNNLPPLLSGQLPSQALQCLSALTANAQALGQLLPPMPGLLPPQVMPPPTANSSSSTNSSSVKFQSQTLNSSTSDSTYVNVPDSSTEPCAANSNPTTQVENSVTQNTSSGTNTDTTAQNQGTLPGIMGFNPSDAISNQNQQYNQALQQQGLPPIMLPAAGQNLINVNMAGVNPMLPMALFMLPNGNPANHMIPGITPQALLPGGVGPKMENDAKMEDEEHEVENIQNLPESPAATLFDCPICHKPFPNTKQRAVHMRIHSKYEHKPFVCDICGFRTKYADRLRIHKRLQHTHKGIKPFKCPYCPYATSLKGNCRKHVMNKHPNCAVIVEQIMPI